MKNTITLYMKPLTKNLLEQIVVYYKLNYDYDISMSLIVAEAIKAEARRLGIIK